MSHPHNTRNAERNIALYPWFAFLRNLVFWQAVWFLFFQAELSASQAVLLYVIYDIATTVFEVPSGYMSDRLGRRVTLIASAIAGLTGAALIGFGQGFMVFAIAQVFMGASSAFASGTDSALLFESLSTVDRQHEIEQQELRAWRFGFSALALSSVMGGFMTLWDGALPFLAGAVAFAGVLLVTLKFAEPVHSDTHLPQGAELIRLGSLQTALREPVLIWLFALAVLMYVFSHVLFVYGQPFILQALQDTGFQQDAPVVSGSVSAVMMALSVAASLFAPALRKRLGLPMILLAAFALQIAICGTLAFTDAILAITVLFLRMVPNSLSRPFVLARIQPLLSNDSRATYLSLQSFAARLILAATLYATSLLTPDQGQMGYADIQQVLIWYISAGVFCLVVLALAARHLTIEADPLAQG